MKENVFLFFIKLLISIVLTLVILIITKASSEFKTFFYKKVYVENISFAPISELYNKYIGQLNIFNNKAELVFNESIIYSNKEKYLEGVKLELNDNLVSVNKSGIVVYIGEKEGYGKTVIVQRVDGIDEWYGGIVNTNLKLYDYVYQNSLLGEVDKYLYLVYKKDGNALDYEEYIN